MEKINIENFSENISIEANYSQIKSYLESMDKINELIDDLNENEDQKVLQHDKIEECVNNNT